MSVMVVRARFMYGSDAPEVKKRATIPTCGKITIPPPVLDSAKLRKLNTNIV